MATGFTETTGTLSNSAATVAANAGRRGLIIGNPSDSVMTYRIGATASATAGVPVPAGGHISFLVPNACPDGAVSLFCAGASKAYTIYEW